MKLTRPAAALVLALALAGCGADEKTVMPDVVGKRLDVAQSDIERAGFGDDVEVVGGGMFGIVDESNWQVCAQLPTAGDLVTDVPRLTVDRSCGDAEEEPADAPSEEPEPEAEATYSGPAYEVVVADDDLGPARLTQYWVYTDQLDTSTAAYKDQVKAIITDIARQQNTHKLLVEVVTDKEIAQAEAFSTFQRFVDEHEPDYYLKTIPEKEKLGWVASYAGGIDELGEPSDADEASEVTWMVASDHPEPETWRPEVTG